MQIYKALKRKQSLTRRRCPQQNECVFSNRRNSRKVCSESRRWRGRLFHRRGLATVNERSTRLVQDLGTRGDIGRSKSLSVDNTDKLAVIRQILWRQDTKKISCCKCHRFVHHHQQIILQLKNLFAYLLAAVMCRWRLTDVWQVNRRRTAVQLGGCVNLRRSTGLMRASYNNYSQRLITVRIRSAVLPLLLLLLIWLFLFVVIIICYNLLLLLYI